MLNDIDFRFIEKPLNQEIINYLQTLAVIHNRKSEKMLTENIKTTVTVLNNIYNSMMKGAVKSLLFPRQQNKSRPNFAVDKDNIVDFLEHYSDRMYDYDVCDEVYSANIHICDAIESGLEYLAGILEDDHDRLLEDHDYHKVFVEGCSECEAERIEDKYELLSLNYDYMRMCR